MFVWFVLLVWVPSGACWPFVKRFSKVYLTGFHIITLAGQTLIRSGEKMLGGGGLGWGKREQLCGTDSALFSQGNGD